MKRRCTNPADDKYYRYGARGIKVCDEWLNWDTFFAWAEGRYRPGLSINRIDNDGGYNPENCEFTDVVSQARNKSSNHLVTAFGETKILIEWVEDPRCVVTYAALQLRLTRRKWDPEKAITTPLIKNNREATHCPSGHAYTLDNIYRDGPGGMWRSCRTCKRAYQKKRYAEKKGSASGG